MWKTLTLILAMAFQTLSAGLLGSNSFSHSITINSSCNKLLVFLYMEAYETTASANLSGTSMTQAAIAATPIVSGFYGKCAAFYLDNPSTGSQTVNFTGVSPENRVISCFAQMEDAASGIEDAVAAAASNPSSSTSISDTLTIGTSGCIAFSMSGTGDGGDTMTRPTGWSVVDGIDNDDYLSTSTYSFATNTISSNETVEWTASPAVRRHAMSAIAVAPASTGPEALTGSTGALNYSSNTASLEASRLLTGNAGAYNYSSNQAGVNYNRVIEGQQGAFAYSSNTADLIASRVLSGQSGAQNYASNTAGVNITRRIEGSAGAASYASNQAGLSLNRLLQCQTGTYNYAGTQAELKRNIVLIASSGAYNYDSNTATLTINTTSSDLVGLTGNLGYGGGDAELRLNRILTGNTGNATYTGNDADLARVLKLTGQAGSFAISGNDADLLMSRILTGQSGAFNYDSNTANLVLGADVVTVTISGTSLITQTLSASAPISQDIEKEAVIVTIIEKEANV